MACEIECTIGKPKPVLYDAMGRKGRYSCICEECRGKALCVGVVCLMVHFEMGTMGRLACRVCSLSSGNSERGSRGRLACRVCSLSSGNSERGARGRLACRVCSLSSGNSERGARGRLVCVNVACPLGSLDKACFVLSLCSLSCHKQGTH